jgi:DNA repair exonuclease SbcCD nuclease subunit
MRILHTSDLHLAEKRPKRMEALENILKVAREHGANLLTISGDMFESEKDAEALRPRLRSVFQGNPFRILAIPGNHDRHAFRRNVDFGPDFQAATQEPYEIVRFDDDVELVALPFEDRPTADLLAGLRDAAHEANCRILLLHCTLDIGYGNLDFGREEIREYFPISVQTLAGLGYDYILAGHFHKSTHILPLQPKGYFVYPGSPVSLTAKEVGERQAVLVDLGEPPKAVPLKTFFRDCLRLVATPGREDQILEELRRWVYQREGKDCHLEVEVTGFIAREEQGFREEIEAIAGIAKLNLTHRDVRQVLEHPLFRRFEEKLQDIQDEEQCERVRERTVEALVALLADRRIAP